MFSGFDGQRVLTMSEQEKRWFDNIKKAFYASDLALQSGDPEDDCLQELLKAIDTAKTLRRSLRGDDVSHRENKKRFIEFLALEILPPNPDAKKVELRDRLTKEKREYNLGDVIYAIRCMVHENENLNAAEGIDHHILLDWSHPHRAGFIVIEDERFICNAYLLANRLREVLAKFITGIEGMLAFATNADSFSITIRPDLGSIWPVRKVEK